ncbi:hypothetical protein T439DRAFT_17392 [Meredithblackwellia eburnea MCA 4105]
MGKASSASTAASTSKPGRKLNESLELTPSRLAQRAFRQRRLEKQQALDARIADLERENQLLNEKLAAVYSQGGTAEYGGVASGGEATTQPTEPETIAATIVANLSHHSPAPAPHLPLPHSKSNSPAPPQPRLDDGDRFFVSSYCPIPFDDITDPWPYIAFCLAFRPAPFVAAAATPPPPPTCETTSSAQGSTSSSSCCAKPSSSKRSTLQPEATICPPAPSIAWVNSPVTLAAPEVEYNPNLCCGGLVSCAPIPEEEIEMEDDPTEQMKDENDCCYGLVTCEGLVEEEEDAKDLKGKGTHSTSATTSNSPSSCAPKSSCGGPKPAFSPATSTSTSTSSWDSRPHERRRSSSSTSISLTPPDPESSERTFYLPIPVAWSHLRQFHPTVPAAEIGSMVIEYATPCGLGMASRCDPQLGLRVLEKAVREVKGRLEEFVAIR